MHVRSWSTVPLLSGCEVSKQKQKIVFGMDSLGKIPRYLAGENLEQKKRKIKYTRPRACRFTEREREREREKERDRETERQTERETTDRKTAVLTGG